MLYRKKPVVIEAVPALDVLRYVPHEWDKLPPWIQQNYESGVLTLSKAGVHISTLEGAMVARAGDWIIQGIKMELYPCKNDIFVATYDPV